MMNLPGKIAIAGPTSSGKTTLARRLSALTGAPHIELDALFHGPNWTPAEEHVFRARVSAAIDQQAWITDGNYKAIRDLTWGNADLVIWLDFPLPLTLVRLLRRTNRRIRAREELWNGNRESWRVMLTSKDSLIWWALTTHQRHRRSYPLEFQTIGKCNPCGTAR
jgi:adenylate kinase family enzyme